MLPAAWRPDHAVFVPTFAESRGNAPPLEDAGFVFKGGVVMAALRLQAFQLPERGRKFCAGRKEGGVADGTRLTPLGALRLRININRAPANNGPKAVSIGVASGRESGRPPTVAVTAPRTPLSFWRTAAPGIPPGLDTAAFLILAANASDSRRHCEHVGIPLSGLRTDRFLPCSA